MEEEEDKIQGQEEEVVEGVRRLEEVKIWIGVKILLSHIPLNLNPFTPTAEPLNIGCSNGSFQHKHNESYSTTIRTQRC